MRAIYFIKLITAFQLLGSCQAEKETAKEKRLSSLRAKRNEPLIPEDKSSRHELEKNIETRQRKLRKRNEMKILSDSVPYIDLTIINGLYTEKDRYDYMVSLTDSAENHVCGGSLISPELILTAAHCGGHFSRVQIGRYDTGNSSENYEVFDIVGSVKHPEYDSKYLKNDFMIVKIEGRSTYPAVKLINKGQNIPDDLTVFGWGVTDANGFPYKGPLLEAHLKYVSNDECTNSNGYIDGIWGSYYGLIKENMMCAYSANSDACFGDSGGPLIIKGTTMSDDIQVGVVSWGFGCNHPQFPGVYARIDNQIEWIQSVACILSNDDSTSNFKCNRRPARDSALDTSCTPKRGCEEGFLCLNGTCRKEKDKPSRDRTGP